ncbi:MAG: HEAT repeat domain-containing protein, partial [Acidobacteriota bacterium]|nr:HEAT repeat domain-containing protein [Acidobacteriota bacterium]
CYKSNAKGHADTSLMNSYSSVTYSSSTQAQVRFTGGTSNPLVETKIPTVISWDMNVIIDDTNPQSPQANVNYNHTCYPAHIVEVNGQCVYEYRPPYNHDGYIGACLTQDSEKLPDNPAGLRCWSTASLPRAVLLNDKITFLLFPGSAMRMKLLQVSFLFLVAFSGICCAEERAHDTFLSLINQPDDSKLPNIADTVMGMYAGNLTVEEVREALPLARQCLLSPRESLHAYGIDFMFTVAMRSDSSELLDPYLHDIPPLFRSADPAMKRAAFGLFAYLNPKPSPKAVSLLAPHLEDKTNTPENTETIAATLLRSSPDSGMIHFVLAAMSNKGDARLKRLVIEALGANQIQAEESLKVIHEGLTDASMNIRRTSVEAVSRMPKNVQDGFSADLHKLVGNPDENAETRSLALAVLTGSHN